MSDNLIDIHVRIDGSEAVSGKTRYINMVSFGGYSEGLFEGTIMPHAVDTQIYSGGGSTLNARYMLEGNDRTGRDCRMFIDNFKDNGAEKTVPRIFTDSPLLSWLETEELEGSIDSEEGGIRIGISRKAKAFVREEHSFTVFADGRRIYGELYTPTETEGPYPTVIMSHGYNCSAEIMRRDAEKLATYGICVYAYDFCGASQNSKSSGKTTDMSIASEQRDLIDVLSHIEGLGISDGIWLYGASQGGFVTGLTAPCVSERIKGIFLIFPAYCIPDDWRDRKLEYKGGDFDFWGVTLGRAFMDGLPDYDVFERTAEYEGHVYIFHGTEDCVVRREYAQKLAQSCKNAHLFLFPNEGHGFSDRCLDSCIGKAAEAIRDTISSNNNTQERI